MRKLWHIYRIGLKELISFRYDYTLIILLIYAFSIMVIVPAKEAGVQVRNASVGFADEDNSRLSERIRDAVQPPQFKTARTVSLADINRGMDRGEYTFVINIPPGFQNDVLSGRRPVVRIDVDATATGHAKLGTNYLRRIITEETNRYLYGVQKLPGSPVQLNIRVKYNPNRESHWFMGIVFLMKMITLLSVLLPAAALIRERERGTVEHLLVMPLTPAEIIISKVWANSLVILTGAMISLLLAVRWFLGVPLSGSILLYAVGTVVYLFATTGLGIFLGTIAKSQPQMGLLCLPIVTPIVMLSGGMTPIEAMPVWLQNIVSFTPTSHYLEFASTVLICKAGIDIVWKELIVMMAIGTVLFTGAMLRFRKTFR
jgi:ABC-2 type transport system permease protein